MTRRFLSAVVGLTLLASCSGSEPAVAPVVPSTTVAVAPTAVPITTTSLPARPAPDANQDALVVIGHMGLGARMYGYVHNSGPCVVVTYTPEGPPWDYAGLLVVNGDDNEVYLANDGQTLVFNDHEFSLDGDYVAMEGGVSKLDEKDNVDEIAPPGCDFDPELWLADVLEPTPLPTGE